MSFYPALVPTFTIKTNKVDLVDADHVNYLQREVVALATYLGTNPQGNLGSLTARLAVMIDTAGAVLGSSGYPGTTVARQLYYRTDTETLYVRNSSNSAWSALGGSLSNRLFQYQGQINGTGTSAGTQGTDWGEAVSTSMYNYGTGSIFRYLYHRNDTTYGTCWTSKFYKSSGITTVKVYWRSWLFSAATGYVGLKLAIGSAVVTATGTFNNVSPEWLSFDVDVSGLVNGSAYDVVAQNACVGGNIANAISDIIGFGV